MQHFEPSSQRPVRDEYPYADAADRLGAGGGGIGLDRAVRALLRRWWYPVIGAAALFAAAWFWVPHDIVRYRAQAVVRLDDSRQALTGGIAGPTQENTRTPDFMISQVHVIRSQAVLGDVVDSLGLRLQPSSALRGLLVDVRVEHTVRNNELQLDFDEAGYAVRAGELTTYGLYGEPVTIAGIQFTIGSAPPVDTASMHVVPREVAVQRLELGLVAAPRDRAAIIDIVYTSTEMREAQLVVNAVAQSYQNHNTAGVREAARRRREFIESQWREAEARHDQAQQRLNAFRASRQPQGSQERLRQQQAALLAFDAEQQRLDGERQVLQSFLDRIEQATDEHIYQELRTLVLAPGMTPSPLLSQLYTQLSQHLEERGRLLAAGRAPTHPDVERLTRLITSARSSVVDGARTQLSSVDLRISSLQEQRARGATALQGLPDAESEELSLTQEVSTARGMADGLQAEYHRARIAEAVDAGQAEILDFAASAVPLPAGRRTQKLTIALVLGMMLGSVVALGLEATNRSIRWRGEMEEFSAIPSLAVIPRVFAPSARFPGLFRRNGGQPAARGKGEQTGLLPAADFHTVGAEAYRILRTNLTFLRREDRLGTLVVTSAASGEGKSTTAANLAASMARQSMRVLLVDCDLRRPRQHRIFGIEGGPGFVDVLLGKAGRGDAVYPTRIDGLWLMPRGGFHERAAEILGGQEMRQLMAAVREEYDIVILDTPPALVAADASAVAALVDGVLLIVRAGQTPRDAVRRTLQQLQAVRANVIGFVLNDPDTIADKYGEYMYSKHYYTVET